MFPAADREISSSTHEDAWIPEPEGQLSIDVIETDHEVIVRSAIAGARAEDFDIHVTQDTVTIRGRRIDGERLPEPHVKHLEECYWGAFSRSIVLPCHVRPEDADAIFRNGILTLRLKKAQMPSRISIISLDE
jgi:HSP20 family protein